MMRVALDRVYSSRDTRQLSSSNSRDSRNQGCILEIVSRRLGYTLVCIIE